MSIEINSKLLHEIQKGNKQAFGQLIDQCSNFVYAVALKMHGDRDEAWDSTQDSFVKVWQKFDSYKINFEFTTWLYRIVINTCVDRMRKEKRQKKHFESASGDLMNISNFDNPENALEEKQLMEFVRKAAQRLSAKQHAVFVLHDLEQFSQEEISEMLDMAKNRVKSNLYYARKTIRAMLVINEKINQNNEM